MNPLSPEKRRQPAWFGGIAVVLLAAGFEVAAEPSGEAERAVIQFVNGDFVGGKLVDSLEADQFAWQSPAFATPFQIPRHSVNAIRFPIPAAPAQPAGDYCFELTHGDVLFGSLVEVGMEAIALEAIGIGRLHVERSQLRRMFRWQGTAEVVYSGPSGLSGWKDPGNGKGWREEGGHLLTDQSGATLRRDVGLPARSRIEFELSWKSSPDFTLALGVSDNPKSATNAFRFDVWEDELVIHRETEREADVAPLKAVGKSAGRVHLQVFLDQPQGRLLVCSSTGQQLAELLVAAAKPQALGGLQLTNNAGDVRLERLTVNRWNGELPLSEKADTARIHTLDGAVTYGQLQSYDASQRRLIVRTETGEQTIAEDQIQVVHFPHEEAAPERVEPDAAATNEALSPRTVAGRSLRASLLNAQQIGGDLVKVERDHVWLRSPAIRELIGVPVNGLASLINLNPLPATATQNGATKSHPRVGRLELPGTVLSGRLVETPQGEAGRLAWQPVQCETSSLMQPDVSARIIYREPQPQKPQAVATPRQVRVAAQGGLIGQVQNLLGTNGAPVASRPQSKTAKPILHLRSGDTIPCDITGIDEQGVRFTSASTEATFVRHDQLQALEILSDASPVQIPKTKKERLLMLPRVQRDNPPTHLVRSIDGDYLRGRLVSMDEQQLQMEIRLETKMLQRDRVARIIWLHPKETGQAAESTAPRPSPAGATPPLTGMRVQSLPSDGNRLTFFVDRFDGTHLTGRSELLGVCRADLGQIDQLLIGATIEQVAATLAFHQWKLKAATDPLAAREDGDASGDGGEGRDAALVGKPAPDFELKLLDGSAFRLSGHRQKVVILDFWASWCGPCLQVMPQVDKVAHEFADRGVELVAVNLEERADRINTALERLKLKTTVALDQDGRVAEKYGATSIPQTVIIDRTGKVVRLFIGGGPRFGDQLRTALEQVLQDKAENEVTPPRKIGESLRDSKAPVTEE